LQGNFNAYDHTESFAIDADEILSIFEEEIELDLEEGRLQRDDRIHLRYTQALRVALNRSTSSNHSEFSLGFQVPGSANEVRSPSSNGLSSNAPASRPTLGRQRLLSDGFGQTGDFQGTIPSMEGFFANPSNRYALPGETERSESYARASVQASRGPTRAGSLNANMDFASSSSLVDLLPNSPSPHGPGSSLHAAPVPTEQMFLSQGELGQEELEAILGCNPDIAEDCMELPSFHATFNEPAPYSSDELSTEENGFLLRGDINNESLMDQVDYENQSTGARATWYSENRGSKNEGNKYLNPSWNPQCERNGF
jgi:hypothetical protein